MDFAVPLRVGHFGGQTAHIAIEARGRDRLDGLGDQRALLGSYARSAFDDQTYQEDGNRAKQEYTRIMAEVHSALLTKVRWYGRRISEAVDCKVAISCCK
jgi:hypothetical protein